MASDRGCSTRRDEGDAHREETFFKRLKDFKKFSTGLYACLLDTPGNWGLSLNGSLKLAATHVEDVDNKTANSTILSPLYVMTNNTTAPSGLYSATICYLPPLPDGVYNWIGTCVCVCVCVCDWRRKHTTRLILCTRDESRSCPSSVTRRIRHVIRTATTPIADF